MNKKFTERVVRFYLWLTRNTTRKLVLPTEKTRDYFNLSMADFSKIINAQVYKPDPLGGAWDYIDSPDNFFDTSKKQGRDCDDWARMWSLWGLYNEYRAYEYVVSNPSKLSTTFNTMHCITVLEKDGRFWLMNYRPYGPRNSLESALEQLSAWEDYKDNKLIVLDREVVLPKS